MLFGLVIKEYMGFLYPFEICKWEIITKYQYIILYQKKKSITLQNN